jgi:hypothetical protein
MGHVRHAAELDVFCAESRRKRLSSSSQASDWTEIPIVERRRTLNFIWNPQRRYVKFLIDCICKILMLARFYQKNNLLQQDITNRLCLSVPYLLILNSVMQNIDASEQIHNYFIQFAIVESYGLASIQDPRPVLVSAFHLIK